MTVVPPQESGDRRRWVVLGVVAVGTLLSALASSTVNLALPSLGAELGIPIDRSRHVVLSFLVATTLFLLPAGRVCDRFSHRRAWIVGQIVFAAASLLCGATHDFTLLIVGRVVQGLGAALAMAAGPALITQSFAARERGRALGLSASATYIGLTVGPPLGGVLLVWGGWPLTFYFNVPVALVVAVAAAGLLPGGAAPARTRVPLGRLFGSRVFVGAALAALLNYVALFAALILLPFWLEEGLALGSTRIGLLLAVQPAVIKRKQLSKQ